jgi:hypothetical protein
VRLRPRNRKTPNNTTAVVPHETQEPLAHLKADHADPARVRALRASVAVYASTSINRAQNVLCTPDRSPPHGAMTIRTDDLVAFPLCVQVDRNAEFMGKRWTVYRWTAPTNLGKATVT